MSSNPYYDPEDFGLTKVADHDLSDGFYQFDLIVVWADSLGLYLGTDSGCSCPTPFESYAGRSDMTGPLTIDQALEETSNLKLAAYEPNRNLDEWNAFVTTIRNYRQEPSA